jgi:tetratricopeptide (TPR) repeat protein
MTRGVWVLAAVGVATGTATVAAQGFCHPFGFGGFGWPPPPVVVVVPQPVFVPAVWPDDPGGVTLADFRRQVRQEEPAAVAARVGNAVRRGDLLVVEPNGNGIKLAAAVRPVAKPEPSPKPEVVVPNDPAGRAAFHTARAKAAFEAGELGRAEEQFAAAIAAKPDDPIPHFLLAQVRSARGDYHGAVWAIRNGLALAPDWPLSRFRITELYWGQGDRFAADLAELTRTLEARPDDPALLFLAGYHQWFLGERPAARKLFDRAVAKGNPDPAVDRFVKAAER